MKSRALSHAVQTEGEIQLLKELLYGKKVRLATVIYGCRGSSCSRQRENNHIYFAVHRPQLTPRRNSSFQPITPVAGHTSAINCSSLEQAHLIGQ